MNEERRKELMTRTLYFKGFPITATLDEVLEFFNKLTKVENVIVSISYASVSFFILNLFSSITLSISVVLEKYCGYENIFYRAS